MSYTLGAIGAATLADVREGKAVLKRGMFNSQAVKELQALLKVSADGDFGPNTETAVKAAQTKAGMAASGQVDADTLAAIEGKVVAQASVNFSSMSAAGKAAAIAKAKAKAKQKIKDKVAASKAAGGTGRPSSGASSLMPSGKTLALAGGGLAALVVLGVLIKRRRTA